VGDSGVRQGVALSHTHLCQVFDDHAEFRAAAVEFLADGLAHGARVRYIALTDEDTLRADLAPLMRMPEAHRPGSVEVLSVSGTYAGPEACVDPQAQVDAYTADTDAALADGFTGFRVAAEVTVLVRTPAQLDAFCRYEHQADRLMSRIAFTAMCGYRRAELGDDAVGQLACLHPAGGGEQAPFRLHATRGADIALSGELDLTTVHQFATAVDHTGLVNGAAEVVVDATSLEFADHRNLLVLERMADRYGRTVVLRTARRWPARLVAALDLAHVRVEPGTRS
jgi:anti-anti-sigma regulatory factor